MDRTERLEAFRRMARQRILLLDGAMGTMIQDHKLSEDDYRGKRFASYKSDLKGNNDLLNLTQPRIIREIHLDYLHSGADMITSNTFNANSTSMAEYGLEGVVGELNTAGAALAREAADAAEAEDPDRPRFVVGAIGPTSKTTSISPDVNDPGYRAVSFDDIKTAYAEAARALIKGGADMLMLETVFDTLNAKAGLFALETVFDELGYRVPVMISGTITDLSGRTLTGQTTEAFWNSVSHAGPISVGLNCAFGAEQLRPYVQELSRVADTLISAHPNAGLPNEFGEYDEAPETTAGFLAEWAEAGLVNILGGCCGTTPDHIKAIAAAVQEIPPREIPERPPRLRLSGLEAFEVQS